MDGTVYWGKGNKKPRLRRACLHRHKAVQSDVQDHPGGNGGFPVVDLFKAGDRPGYICELQERNEEHQEKDALRDSPDR